MDIHKKNNKKLLILAIIGVVFLTLIYLYYSGTFSGSYYKLEYEIMDSDGIYDKVELNNSYEVFNSYYEFKTFYTKYKPSFNANESKQLDEALQIFDEQYFSNKSLLLVDTNADKLLSVKIHNNIANLNMYYDQNYWLLENLYFIPINNSNIKNVNISETNTCNLTITIQYLSLFVIIFSVYKYILRRKEIRNITDLQQQKKQKRRQNILLILNFILAIILFFVPLFNALTVSSDKPIIYLYPEEETKVEVKLGYPNKLTHTYPKYDKSWQVIAKPNGDLIDLKTGRNLYSLYWEGINTVPSKPDEGFVVKGEDTIKFLEEKLAILGLTEREANEFIIYWLPKLETNPYNYIRFETIEEINSNMPLTITPKPDSIIRVLMEYKPLKRKINVKEQILTTPKREGFVVVEWGGSKLK